MGYYSFYRIIKDILYNLKKNKVLVIVAIIILTLFICNKVFATNDIIIKNPYNNQEVNVTFPSWVEQDNLNYFFMYKFNSQTSFYYVLFYFDKNDNITLTKQPDGSYKLGGMVYLNTLHKSYNWNWYYEILDNIRNQTKPNKEGGGGYYIPASYVNLNNYYTNANIKDTSGNIIFKNNSIKYPQVTTSIEDLQTLNFDTISVSAWNWSNKDLYILFYDRSLMNNQNTEGLYPKKEIKLAQDTSYYVPEISSEENAIYWIANDNTGLNFKVGGKYEIRLAERVPQSTGGGFRGDDLYSYNYLGDSVQFEISENVSAEKLKELNEQTKANEEKERHDETIGAINNQTQATQDLNNSITDSNVTTDVELPSDTTENPTENGLNNIF